MLGLQVWLVLGMIGVVRLLHEQAQRHDQLREINEFWAHWEHMKWVEEHHMKSLRFDESRCLVDIRTLENKMMSTSFCPRGVSEELNKEYARLRNIRETMRAFQRD